MIVNRWLIEILFRIYRRQYHEEREHPEWIDHGGES